MDVENENRANDEVAQFLDARYVGPCEAVWRILEFPLRGISHAVEALPVHVDGSQRVTFTAGDLAAREQLEERLPTAQLARSQLVAASPRAFRCLPYLLRELGKVRWSSIFSTSGRAICIERPHTRDPLAAHGL